MIFLQEKRRNDGVQSKYEVISNYFDAVLVPMVTLMTKISSKPSDLFDLSLNHEYFILPSKIAKSTIMKQLNWQKLHLAPSGSRILMRALDYDVCAGEAKRCRGTMHTMQTMKRCRGTRKHIVMGFQIILASCRGTRNCIVMGLTGF